MIMKKINKDINALLMITNIWVIMIIITILINIHIINRKTTMILKIIILLKIRITRAGKKKMIK